MVPHNGWPVVRRCRGPAPRCLLIGPCVSTRTTGKHAAPRRRSLPLPAIAATPGRHARRADRSAARTRRLGGAARRRRARARRGHGRGHERRVHPVGRGMAVGDVTALGAPSAAQRQPARSASPRAAGRRAPAAGAAGQPRLLPPGAGRRRRREARRSRRVPRRRAKNAELARLAARRREGGRRDRQERLAAAARRRASTASPAASASAAALWAHCHTGLDFAAPSGTPVHGVANGVVTETGYAGAYGNRLILTPRGRHRALVLPPVTSFGVERRPGGRRRPGRSALVGSTGNTTGPHLHLEVRPGGGDAVDPDRRSSVKGQTP